MYKKLSRPAPAPWACILSSDGANHRRRQRPTMSVTVFVTHSSLTDLNAEVKLSSELSVADVKKKRPSHVEQGPYRRRPKPAQGDACNCVPPERWRRWEALGGLAPRPASVSLGQLAGVLCCGPRRPCFLHRLESRCGTAPQHQHLTLLDPSGKVIASHPHPHTRTHTHTHALTSSHLTPHTHALAPTLTPSHPGDRVARR